MRKFSKALAGVALLGAFFVCSLVHAGTGAPSGGGAGLPFATSSGQCLNSVRAGSSASVWANCGVPAFGTVGNIIVDTGVGWSSFALIPGDIAWDNPGVTAKLDIVGQDGLLNTGTKLSSTIAGQSYQTNGTGNLAVVTQTLPIKLSLSGTPISSMVLPQSVPYAMQFNANFASSTGVPAAFGSCNNAPSETDTWAVWCTVSSTWTQIGTIATTTSCNRAGAGVTFATTGGTAQTCDNPSRLSIIAPVTVSGSDQAFTLVSHE